MSVQVILILHLCTILNFWHYGNVEVYNINTYSLELLRDSQVLEIWEFQETF